MKATIRPFSDPEARREALTLLNEGELIVLPTDTVYGIAAQAGRGARRLMERFHPRYGKPPWPLLPLLLATPEDAERVVRSTPAARRLIRRFWPGVLTLLLLPQPLVAAWGRRVAVRVPSHRLLRDFLREAGGSLVVWRAAFPGEPSATRAEEAAMALGESVALILDGGPTRYGLRSTAVDAIQRPPRLVQRGALPLAELRAVMPELTFE